MRVPEVEHVYILILPLAGHWFYHELWDKKYKVVFTLCNCVYAGLVLILLKTPEAIYAALALYYGIFFFFKMFHRFPENALKQYKLTNNNNLANNNNQNEKNYQKMLYRRTSSMIIDLLKKVTTNDSIPEAITE